MRPPRLVAAISLLLACTALHAGEHPVKAIGPERLTLGTQHVALGASQRWQQPLPGVQKVLIVIHGRLRNAMTYLHSVEQAADHAGQLSTTLILAPQFLNQRDIKPHALPDTVLRWHANDWMAGAPAQGLHAPSAYAVLDQLLAQLNDRQRFPALNQVIIAGHSGGAQVVQRYALTSQADAKLNAAGIKVRYVIANPSSYAYFSRQRPLKGFNPATCPGFNRWKYGLEDLPSYANGQTPEHLEQAYIQRDITYLLGAEDIDPQQPALDRSCAALAQGADRLSRGHLYFDYLRQRHPSRLNQRLIEVPGVGHNGQQMFNSPAGQAALFGE